jgi:hypothetical protein
MPKRKEDWTETSSNNGSVAQKKAASSSVAVDTTRTTSSDQLPSHSDQMCHENGKYKSIACDVVEVFADNRKLLAEDFSIVNNGNRLSVTIKNPPEGSSKIVVKLINALEMTKSKGNKSTTISVESKSSAVEGSTIHFVAILKREFSLSFQNSSSKNLLSVHEYHQGDVSSSKCSKETHFIDLDKCEYGKLVRSFKLGETKKLKDALNEVVMKGYEIETVREGDHLKHKEVFKGPQINTYVATLKDPTLGGRLPNDLPHGYKVHSIGLSQTKDKSCINMEIKVGRTDTETVEYLTYCPKEHMKESYIHNVHIKVCDGVAGKTSSAVATTPLDPVIEKILTRDYKSNFLTDLEPFNASGRLSADQLDIYIRKFLTHRNQPQCAKVTCERGKSRNYYYYYKTASATVWKLCDHAKQEHSDRWPRNQSIGRDHRCER